MSFDFYKLVDKSLSFLVTEGFKASYAEPIKGELSVSFSSNNLMILLCYESYNNECWCVVGSPREHYPAKSVALNELIDFHGLDIQLSNKPELHLSQLAAILQSELVTLTQDSTFLLEPFWAEIAKSEKALCEYQNAIAFSIVELGHAQILELPNTEDALGKEYCGQFPHHNFALDRLWLVRSGMVECLCESFESAVDAAKNFGA